MKSILKNSMGLETSWTPRTLVLAGFASGLFAGALALVAIQTSIHPSEDWQEAELQPGSPVLSSAPGSGGNTPPMTLAQELAKIEADAERENSAQKAANAAETAPRVVQVTSTPPRIAHEVDPVYPRLAKVGHFQGPVEVKVRVNQHGYPAKVTALNGNAILQQAAVEAAKKWRFHPARTDGQPVPSDFKIRFEFKLA